MCDNCMQVKEKTITCALVMRQAGIVFGGVCASVCVSVCPQKISNYWSGIDVTW